MDLKKQANLAASLLGKLRMEKSPFSKEQRQENQKKSVIARARNKKRAQEEKDAEKA